MGEGVQWTIVMQCPESLLKPVIYKVKCSSVTIASAKKTHKIMCILDFL